MLRTNGEWEAWHHCLIQAHPLVREPKMSHLQSQLFFLTNVLCLQRLYHPFLLKGSDYLSINSNALWTVIIWSQFRQSLEEHTHTKIGSHSYFYCFPDSIRAKDISADSLLLINVKYKSSLLTNWVVCI